jgi:hypothetical protein
VISFWRGLAFSSVALGVAIIALILVGQGLHFAAAIAGVALIAMFVFAFLARWPWQG